MKEAMIARERTWSTSVRAVECAESVRQWQDDALLQVSRWSREDEGARRRSTTTTTTITTHGDGDGDSDGNGDGDGNGNDNGNDNDNNGNDYENDNDACTIYRGKSSILFRVLESLTEEEPKLTRVCGSRETLSPSPSAGAGGGALLRPRASD